MKKRIINLLFVLITCLSMGISITPLYAVDINEVFNMNVTNAMGTQTLTFKVISETDKTVQLGTGETLEANTEFKGDLVVPEEVLYKNNKYSVITIAEHAFEGNVDITSVRGNSIIKVEASAFLECTGITTFHFPQAIMIENSAFKRCNNLTTINLPWVTKVINSAFEFCKNLKTALLPKVTTIASSAFNGCEGLIKINIPEVSTIGESAFSNCKKLETISLPKLGTIHEFVFDGCESLKTVIMPEVKTIKKSAFVKCSSLSSMVLGLNDNNYTFADIVNYPQTIYLPSDSIVTELKFGTRNYLEDGLGTSTTLPRYSLNVTDPLSVNKLRGEKVELTVDAGIKSGAVLLSDAMTYQWQKKVDGQWIDLKNQTKATLSFDKSTYDDVGEYRCYVASTDFLSLTAETNSAEVSLYSFIADIDKSEISGIEEGKTYSKGSIIEFTVNGAGMDIKGYQGDTRYIPTGWKVNSSGHFTGNYTEKLDTKDLKLGQHKLEITFVQQKYESGIWKNISEKTYTKSVSFVIGAKNIVDTMVPKIISEQDLKNLAIKDENKILIRGLDYIIKTENKGDKVTVTIIGKGDYAGTVTREYMVIKDDSKENIPSEDIPKDVISDKKEENMLLPKTGDTSNIIFLSLGFVLSGCLWMHIEKSKKSKI